MDHESWNEEKEKNFDSFIHLESQSRRRFGKKRKKSGVEIEEREIFGGTISEHFR